MRTSGLSAATQKHRMLRMIILTHKEQTIYWRCFMLLLSIDYIDAGLGSEMRVVMHVMLVHTSTALD
jgi:hypothetical protein